MSVQPSLPVSVKATIAIALFSSVTSLVSGYYHNDKALEHRLTTVEVKQENTSDSLKRVETKLDKLVEWALGKQ